MKRIILTLALFSASSFSLIPLPWGGLGWAFHSSLTTAQAQEYKMAGPYEVVARDGEFRGSKNGSERDL